MKTKITFISVVTLSIALLLTSCSGKGTVSTTEPQNTTAEDSTASADNSNTKLDDLYQQENRIFAEHKDIWDKLFGLMNKNTADSNGNYADHLADTAESNKDSFTDDEFKTLTDDIETIRKIEEQIAEIEKETTESDNNVQKILENNPARMIEKKDILTIPEREADGNKGTSGKVLIAAGSRSMGGAAFMSAQSAYRSGCGLVRVFTHENNKNALLTLVRKEV